MGLWEAKEAKKMNENINNLHHQCTPVRPELERPQSPGQNKFDNGDNQREPSQENTTHTTRRDVASHARDAANNANNGWDE